MNLIERRKKMIIFMTLLLIVIGAFVLIIGKTGSVRAANCPMCPVGTMSSATCTTGPKCGSCGYVNGSALGHKWTTATCVDSSHCSRCGTPGAPATGNHSYSAATCTAPKKCAVCGGTSGAALGHDWVGPTCSNSQYCNRCNATGAPATGNHSYVYDGTKQPSGSAHYVKCSVCGASGTASHKMSNPTCEAAPKCSVCNYTSGASLGGHKWVYDGTKQPSGSVHYTKCSVCGASGTASHKMSSPTCEAAPKCSVCNYTSGASLGGHKWVYDGTKQPSGSAHYTKCSVCGASGTASHKMSNPTCEAAPKCSVCNYTSGVSLGGHKWVYDGTKQPSGSAHYTKCSVCGASGTEPHKMSNPTCEEPAKCSVCNYTSGASLGGHKWVYDGTKTSTESAHYTKCSVCGASGTATHKMSIATCKEPATCGVCKWTNEELADHSFEWSYDSVSTCIRKCSICGQISETDSNIDHDLIYTLYDDNSCTEFCQRCHFTRTVPHSGWQYDGTRKPDSNNHYLKCNKCNGIFPVLHKMNNPTCEEPAKCSVCNYISGSSLGGHKWVYDGTKQPSGSAHYTKCSVCGASGTASHKMVYDGTKQPDQSTHAMKCDVCGEYGSEAHKMSAVTCGTPAKCGVCNWTNGTILEHDWKYDMESAGGHFKYCSNCNTSKWEEHELVWNTDSSDGQTWTVRECKWCGYDEFGEANHTCEKGDLTHYDKTYHCYWCKWCGLPMYSTTKMPHIWKPSGKNCNTYCAICGLEDSGNCEWKFTYDMQYSFEECVKCGAIEDKERHKFEMKEELVIGDNGEQEIKVYVNCVRCEFSQLMTIIHDIRDPENGQGRIDAIEREIYESEENDVDFDFSTLGDYSSSNNYRGALNINCSHDFSAVLFDDNSHWKQCSKCKGIQKNTISSHTLGKAQTASAILGYHIYECSQEGCKYIKTEAHTFDENGNCKAEGCTAKKVADCEHDFTKVCSDDTNHWVGCSICGEVKKGSILKHTMGESNTNGLGIVISTCTQENCGYVSRQYSEDFVLQEEQSNNNNNTGVNNSSAGSNNNGSNNNNGVNNNSNNKTNTQIQGSIPHAGNKTIIIWIIVIATIGIISYIKFKKTI